MGRRIKQTSILTYWTQRYLLILFIGFLIVASVSFAWVRQTTKANRLQMTELIGQEIADHIVGPDGTIRITTNLNELILDRERFFQLKSSFCVIILDRNKQVVYTTPDLTDEDVRRKLSDDMTAARQPGFIATTIPVMYGNSVIGQVILMQAEKALTYFPYEYRLLVLMVLGLAGLGWLTIYLLSRKLSRPIREVAAAAHAVRLGNYDIKLNDQAKEKEISEMIVSFKEMASRLKQSEEWRTIMLAGVTHELKTPVTSIKGLVHAVREDIVSGKEKEEFLDIALKETELLQCMISDLLDYNAFAVGFIEVRKDQLDAGKLIQEILYQWKLSQGGAMEVRYTEPEEPLTVVGDALRIQQIIVNLLTNSKHASQSDQPPAVSIRLRKQDSALLVEVSDKGYGIPAEEQPYIFERFFRGERKKHRTRGLGLGLTFSRMLARAQGGDLILQDSNEEGSTFVLTLPLEEAVSPIK